MDVDETKYYVTARRGAAHLSTGRRVVAQRVYNLIAIYTYNIIYCIMYTLYTLQYTHTLRLCVSTVDITARTK